MQRLIALILGSTLGCAGIVGAPGPSRDASIVPEDLGDVPSPDIARADVSVDSAVPGDADELRRYVDVRPYPVAEVRRRIRPSCPDPSQVGCDVVAMRGAVFDIQTPNGAAGSATARGVSLSSFALDRHEVTVARFRRFVDAGAPSLRFPIRYPGGVVSGLRSPSPEEPPGEREVRIPCESSRLPSTRYSEETTCTWTAAPGANESYPITDTHQRMTWFTAQSFCSWDGGRLPTDAEWVYAAFKVRDGRAAPRMYPRANTWECSDEVVHGPRGSCGETAVLPVGSRRAEGLFYDLGGNVAELAVGAVMGVWNCYGVGLRSDPVCLGEGGTVLAGAIGASYGSDAPTTEPYRLGDYLARNYGFRCAYPVEDP